MDCWDRAAITIAGWPKKHEIPQGVRLNLGCGKTILPTEEGWVNVDRVALEGVDVVMDLFDFPWQRWDDDTVDYVIASHIVEHVPHYIRGVYEDGFFAFFREIHRILKPTGLVTVICPYGMSTGALQDPTHTRLMLAETFGYLSAGAGGDHWDYAIGYAFEALGEGANLYSYPAFQNLTHEQFQSIIVHTWNVVHSMRVDMRPLK